MTPKISYVVSLTRKFIYPKSILQKGLEESDALEKAYQDIHTILHEITHNKYEDIHVSEFFEATVEQNKGYTQKTVENIPKKECNILEIIEFLAMQDIEKKYGIISIEENPDLFQYSTNAQGEDRWSLEDKVENDLNKSRQKYKKLLQNFIYKVEERERVRTTSNPTSLESGRRDTREPTRTLRFSSTPGWASSEEPERPTGIAFSVLR